VHGTGQRGDTGGHLAVGEGVEPRQQFDGSPAGHRILDEFDRALPDRRTVGIGIHDGPDDLMQSHVRLLDGGSHRVDGSGLGELAVGRMKFRDAAGESLLA